VVGGSPEDTQAVRALIASHGSSICSALRFPLQELPSLHTLYSADLEKDHANHDAPADSTACESEGQIATNATNGTNASPGHAQHGVPGGLKMKRIRSIQDLCRDAGSDGVVAVDAIDEVPARSSPQPLFMGRPPLLQLCFVVYPPDQECFALRATCVDWWCMRLL
jgi:hypothetical protein